MEYTADGTGLGVASSTMPAATVDCPFCAEPINARARKCRHCGETVDVAMRKAEEAMRFSERQGQGNVYMNAAVAAPAAPAYYRPVKSKGAAIVLALLLGGLGIHKFYLGRAGWGIIYMLFCWTFIPACIAFVEAIVYACTSDQAFHYKYG